MKRIPDLIVGILGLMGSVIVLLAVIGAFGPLPRMILSLTPGASKMPVLDRVQAEDDIRDSLLQAIGGLVVAVGAITAWRQLVVSRRQYQLSRHTAVTDAFSKAVEQLSATESALRLGGIYSLDRVADDDLSERPRVAEILTSYIRDKAAGETGDRILSRDIVAAVAVLIRRDWPGGIDLERVVLEGMNLRRAHLSNARLRHSCLRGADLTEANLTGSDLTGSDLREARLSGADLRGVDLSEVRLSGSTADRSTHWPVNFDPSAHGVISS